MDILVPHFVVDVIGEGEVALFIFNFSCIVTEYKRYSSKTSSSESKFHEELLKLVFHVLSDFLGWQRWLNLFPFHIFFKNVFHFQCTRPLSHESMFFAHLLLGLKTCSLSVPLF